MSGYAIRKVPRETRVSEYLHRPWVGEIVGTYETIADAVNAREQLAEPDHIYNVIAIVDGKRRVLRREEYAQVSSALAQLMQEKREPAGLGAGPHNGGQHSDNASSEPSEEDA